MKEYRIVSIVLFIGILATSIVLLFFNLSNNYITIVQGILTGCIVSFVTSLTQYFVLKDKVKNDLYLIYLDYYREYFYLLKYQKGPHLKTDNIHKKLVEITPKLNIAIEEYSSFMGKNDSFYKLIHQDIEKKHSINAGDIKNTKSIVNIDAVKKVYGYYAETFKNVLMLINKDRFTKDETEMDEMYKKLNQ